MSNRRDAHLHILGDVLSSGLDMSANKDMIDETQFYRMEGVYADNSKLLSKRLAAVNWGTQILEPKPVDATLNEEISKVFFVNSDWSAPASTGPEANITMFRGAVQVSARYSAAGATASVARPLRPDESYNTNVSHNGSATLSFNVRINNPPSGNFGFIRFAVKEDEMYTVSINSAGIGYEASAGAYATILGTSGLIKPGQIHRVEVTVLAGAAMKVAVDGTYVDTIVTPYARASSDNWIEIDTEADNTLDQDPFFMQISSIMLRDQGALNEAQFVPVKISGITNIKEIKASSSSEVVSLLVQGGRYLWYDYALGEMWRPLAEVGRDKGHFGKFRGSTIVCSYDSARYTEVSKIDGQTLEVTRLDKAPNIRFTTQFANRLWGAGDVDHPLRLYYSGDRQPNLWYIPSDPDNPVTEDAEIGAGYFEFPGTKDRSQITYVSGDFFGSLLVCTSDDIYLLSGTSPADFQRRRLSGAFGASGIYCGVDVFNDHWVLSENGISSVTTTDKYGDLESKRLSYLVRELFDTDKTTSSMLDPSKLRDAIMVYHQKINTVFLWAQEAGKSQYKKVENDLVDSDNQPGVIYAVNIDTGKWSGPWREQITAMHVVKLRSPLKDAVVIGTSDGYVKRLTDAMYSSDTIKLVSPEINGRSIDPRLPMLKKTFGRFRLEIVPTGAWDITFKWKIDDSGWKTVTKKLAIPDKHHITADSTDSVPTGWTAATTSESVARSDTQPMIIEFPIDMRGYSLKYEIETDAPRFKCKRWHLDFVADGYERE